MVRVGFKVQVVIISFVLFDFFLMLYNVENCVRGEEGTGDRWRCSIFNKNFQFLCFYCFCLCFIQQLRFGAVYIWSRK